eukprot:CAMPEP_0114536058 /NCGR_PEP_ID=MMETSP0109-20121206/28783_1 /TAXON_ID=29199 /ORGANISM="Chlorarachnion reptans, Strain CCCM449" /LENGTH=570 /DNA_ID=CAMNT_0001719737 /DNA_START=240 /DNA_END=1952 /DNA_ORIENTATION=-
MSTTAEEVIRLLLKKRSRVINGLPSDFSLYAAQAINSDELFERRLEPSETPLALQEKVREQGHLHHFRFHLRNEARRGARKDDGSPDAKKPGSRRIETAGSGKRRGWEVGTGGGGVPSDGKRRWWGSSPTRFRSHGIGSQRISKCGYLEKKGPRDSNFRMRWFVLQQGKLFYFSNHRSSPMKPISAIDLKEAIVTGTEGSNEFRLLTPDKAYHFLAESPGDVNEWVRHVRKHSNTYDENDELLAIEESIAETEGRAAEADIERNTGLLGLQNALKNPLTLRLIDEFLKANLCDENLEFCIAVNQFERRLKNSVGVTIPKRDSASSASISPASPHPLSETDLKAVEESSFGSESRSRESRFLFETQEEIANGAQRIYDRFLSEDSHRSVCVPQKDKDFVLKCFRKGMYLVSSKSGSRRSTPYKAHEMPGRDSSIEIKNLLGVPSSTARSKEDSPRKSTDGNSAREKGISTCFSRLKRKVLANLETQHFATLSRTPEYRAALMSLPYADPGSSGLGFEEFEEINPLMVLGPQTVAPAPSPTASTSTPRPSFKESFDEGRVRALLREEELAVD